LQNLQRAHRNIIDSLGYRTHPHGHRCCLIKGMSKADELQQRTERFADTSVAFVAGLPDTLVGRQLGRQYLDASTSVAANRIMTARIHSTTPVAPLLAEATELAKIFSASARTARSHRRKRRLGDPPCR
jgi:hypothetical protein